MLYYERKYEARGMIAGVDEAGRGPLAGPVVSAAVILKVRSFKNRIDDSKVLSPKQRNEAFQEIKEKAYFSVGIVDEKTIDRINILRATLLSMQKAVGFLSPRPDFLLVDGNTPLDIEIPFRNIIRGDAKSLSIACASIVAKVTRDRIMEGYDVLYPEYGFRRHKGYPTLAHRQALKINGPCDIHRKTFAYV